MITLSSIYAMLKEDKTVLPFSTRWNSFSNNTEIYYENKYQNMNDSLVLKIQFYIQSNYKLFKNISTQLTAQSLQLLSYDTIINPLKDFFDNLVWDKTPRLDKWLHITYGTPDTRLYSQMGSTYLMGLVNRVLNPGCQFDSVLILGGQQGWFKTTSLRILGDKYYMETSLTADNKDFFQSLQGYMLVEFSEGVTMKFSDIDKLKSIITRTDDVFRKPYAANMETFPRSCVFSMTTNKTEYLRDNTGNRRYYPVILTHKADIKWLKENRDQLLAEAKERLEYGELTYFDSEELEKLQESAQEEGFYDQDVREFWYGITKEAKLEPITIKEIYYYIQKRNNPTGYYKDMDRVTSMSIANSLKTVLHLKKTLTRFRGILGRYWVFTDKTPMGEQNEFNF